MALIESSIFSSSDRRKIIEALENDRYVWRTIDGIIKDTGLDADTIWAVLDDPTTDLVVSSFPDERGRGLYTTRRHYRVKRSVGWRLLGAIADKVA